MVEGFKYYFVKNCWEINFINLFIYLFIYLWLSWVFVAARGLSLVAHSGATLRYSARASHCGGFSLWSTGSRRAGFSSCGMQALERRYSSCGTRA